MPVVVVQRCLSRAGKRQDCVKLMLETGGKLSEVTVEALKCWERSTPDAEGDTGHNDAETCDRCNQSNSRRLSRSTIKLSGNGNRRRHASEMIETGLFPRNCAEDGADAAAAVVAVVAGVLRPTMERR
jgi:hypothetical protein